MMDSGYLEAKTQTWAPNCGYGKTSLSCEEVGLTFIGAKQLFFCIPICLYVTSHPLPPSSVSTLFKRH